MAKFLSDDKLNVAILDIFANAKEEIVIISPFIQLSDRVKFELDKHREDGVHLLVLFGKNPKSVGKSLSKDDVEYLISFPYVTILYNERLHAKYYANESQSIVCSMNLHQYSQTNNFEAGLLLARTGLLDSNTEERDSINYFNSIMDDKNTKVIYDKEPVYEKKLWGLYYDVKEGESVVKENHVDAFYANGSFENKKGYCIRTGKQIPFNLARPYSREAFESWNKYKNKDYREKFCHKTGKPSNGKTSMAHPILNQN